MREEIEISLSAIERDENVRILYACESGSRAWGFESEDSDYDVRFLYIRPRDAYLTVEPGRLRDVIELPIDDVLDINGWDLPKALVLLRRSNPALLEWLVSPIVYRDDGVLAAAMRDLAGVFRSRTACFHHYRSMAKGNFREYLRGDVVKLKKYFYVLRPLLAARWVETREDRVPMEFERLVDALVTDPALRTEIDALVAVKRAGTELDRGPRIEPISAFVESEMKRIDNAAPPEPTPPIPRETLDDLFRETLSRTDP